MILNNLDNLVARYMYWRDYDRCLFRNGIAVSTWVNCASWKPSLKMTQRWTKDPSNTWDGDLRNNSWTLKAVSCYCKVLYLRCLQGVLFTPSQSAFTCLKLTMQILDRTRCEICSKLTIKTPERRYWRRSGVFVNFEHISQLVLVFLLLTLSR